MPLTSDAIAADDEFFAALLSESNEDLEQVLADDFSMIEVMGGSEVLRAELLGAIASGQLRFDSIEPFDRRARIHGSTAIVTGRTRMCGAFGGQAFSVHSRYTHVFVEMGGRWRLAAAQGTPIAAHSNG